MLELLFVLVLVIVLVLESDFNSGCGPNPSRPADMRFIGIASRPPFNVKFEGADAGKIAHYLLRYVSTRNEPGPWSEIHSATIAGL